MELQRSTFSVQVSLFMLLIGVTIAVVYAVTMRPPPPTPAEHVEESLPLSSAEEAAPPPAVRFRDIPPWLFLHVGLIAGAQILALIAAASRADRKPLTFTDTRVVQFLCEIPMYLGLFGTLLGVCLTQFVTGSLVAPLAYLTTMSGILLHVLGKLLIWLPISVGRELDG